MRKSFSKLFVPLALALFAGTLPAIAQPSTNTAPTAAPTERLFLAFIQDAAVANRQWWEGQIEFTDGDIVDALIVRGVVAVQPWKDVEIGGRVGFGDTDTRGSRPDGSGGTDFDLWGKYMIGRDERGADYSVGGILTIPTGDDTAGLGFDAFGVTLFGAARRPLARVTVGGNIGLRFNGDGQFLGSTDIDGRTSALLGGMVVVPVTRDLNFVGELGYESERFDGADDDARLLGGVNWRVFHRGTVRAAIAFGLVDGAPDGQFLVGYAAEF